MTETIQEETARQDERQRELKHRQDILEERQPHQEQREEDFRTWKISLAQSRQQMIGTTGVSGATFQLEDLHLADAPENRVQLPERTSRKGKGKE